MSVKSSFDHRFLAASDLFVGLSDEQTEQLAQLARRREMAPGEILVAEGSRGDSFFLLYSGELAVSTHDAHGKEVALATLTERGASLGEMSIVDPAPRSAQVRTVGPTVVLEVGCAQLETFLATFPDARVVILGNIARVLARRLRQINSRVALGSTL